MLGSAGAWLPLMRAMSGRTLVAFDLPGHGQSGPVDPRRGAHTQSMEVLLALCIAQGDGPIDLIGHSFGATVALRLAIEAPDLVRSLVLIEPVLFALARRTAPTVYDEFLRASAPEQSAFAAGDLDAAAAAFHAHWGGPTAWQALPSVTRRYITERMPLIVGSDQVLHEDVQGLLAGDGLARVDCATQLVSGTQSPSIIESIMDGMAEQIPKAERLVVAGAGHMAPLTHAATLAPALTRFLDGGADLGRVQPPSGSIR
jgi:pimeloyl-ACP methyl ester carboxylesterase